MTDNFRMFKEREFGKWHTVVDAENCPFGPEFGQKILLNRNDDFRWANVKKTVVHVVVDEAADGSPVTEKWQIRF